MEKALNKILCSSLEASIATLATEAKITEQEVKKNISLCLIGKATTSISEHAFNYWVDGNILLLIMKECKYFVNYKKPQHDEKKTQGERLHIVCNEFHLTIADFATILNRHFTETNAGRYNRIVSKWYFGRLNEYLAYYKQEIDNAQKLRMQKVEHFAECYNVGVCVVDGISSIKNALYVSKTFADSFTICKTHEFVSKAQETKLGPAEFTKDIPNVSEEQVSLLDKTGIVPLYANVTAGDLIIGKVRPKSESELTPEEQLLRSIFGEKAREVKDESVYIPENISGVVTDVKIETRKENPLLEKHINMVVTVSVKQSFPLMLGDVLEDNNGNKGIVVGYMDDISHKSHCDIIANFPFNGTKVSRNTSIIELQKARSTDNYSIISGKPFVRNLFNDPQKLSFDNIIKTIHSGHFRDLLYLIIESADPQTRLNVYEHIVSGRTDLKEHVNKRAVSELLFLLNALGIKCIIEYDGKLIDNPKDIFNIGWNKIVNSENLKISFAPLTDEDVELYSYGEISSPETINYRTNMPEAKGLYCQSIFGPIKNWECECGKYKRIRYKGVICDKCGVVVAPSTVRFERCGHIAFPTALFNPIYSNARNARVLVIPPEYRPIIKINYDQYATSDLHDAYRRVITRNNRVIKLKELNAHQDLLKNEQRMLKETYYDLVFGANERCGYIDYLFKWFKNSFENIFLDFSATTRVIINNDIPQSCIGIPINIALELYKPYLMKKLVDIRKVHNIKAAKRIIEQKQKSNDANNILMQFFNAVGTPRLLLMSNNPNGKTLYLTPTISNKSVFELNEKDYAILDIKNAEDLVQAFLPPVSSIAGEPYISDKQVKDFVEFANCVVQLEEIPKVERDRSIVNHILNMKDIDTNSLLFCYLTGRGIDSNERIIALSQFEDKEDKQPPIKDVLASNNDSKSDILDTDFDDLFGGLDDPFDEPFNDDE